jgi:hypothetical protein
MKTLSLAAVGFLLGLSCLPGWTQGGASPDSLSECLATQLLGPESAFTATLQTTVVKSGKESTPAKMAMAMSAGSMRLDMTPADDPSIPAQARDFMRQMGMDQMSVITRADKSNSYWIYPRQRCSVEIPVPKTKTDGQVPTLEKTELGKEVIDGHPCVKQLVTATRTGEKCQAIVWSATDLRDFPVQIYLTSNSTTNIMKFSGISLSPPEASRFEPPTDFKQYSDMNQFAAALAERIIKEMKLPAGGPGEAIKKSMTEGILESVGKIGLGLLLRVPVP